MLSSVLHVEVNYLHLAHGFTGLPALRRALQSNIFLEKASKQFTCVMVLIFNQILVELCLFTNVQLQFTKHTKSTTHP